MGSSTGWHRKSVGRSGRVPGKRRFYHLDLRNVRRPPNFERGFQSHYVDWTPEGKFLYLNFQGSVYAIPLRTGQALPPVPASGFRTKQEVAALPGARLIREPQAIMGPNPSIYAYPRFSTQ